MRLRIFDATFWKEDQHLSNLLTVIHMLIRANVRDTHKDVKEIALEWTEWRLEQRLVRN